MTAICLSELFRLEQQCRRRLPPALEPPVQAEAEEVKGGVRIGAGCLATGSSGIALFDFDITVPEDFIAEVEVEIF